MVQGKCKGGKTVQNKKKAPLRKKAAPQQKKRLRAPPGGLRNPFEKKVPRFITSVQLKNYRVVKRIGAGSYGKVYKAISPSLSNNEVAVKLVDLKDTEFNEFQREYGLTSFLAEHGVGPSIINGWRIKGEGNDVGVIVSDLWDTTLGEFMDNSGKRTVPKNVVNDIEKDLTTMHRLGFVHLDLHEDNVLVKLDSKKRKIEKATICDFGLAKRVSDVSQSDIAEVIDDYELKQTTNPKKLDFLMVREIEKQWK